MARWMIPEHKLDDQQRTFLDEVDINEENVWIRGFPGSGKSVLLAYVANKIRTENSRASLLVVVYTLSLVEMYRCAFTEMGINADVVTVYRMMKNDNHYDYILCDEVQDLTNRMISYMKSHCDHLIVAGDENQSLYETDAQYREPTVNPRQILEYINGRDYELTIIHRLSKSIISIVKKLMPDMDLFKAKSDMAKRDTQVRICKASNSSEEISYIYKEAKKCVDQNESTAILLMKREGCISFVNRILASLGFAQWEEQFDQYGKTDFNQLNFYLRNLGVPIQYVGNGYGSLKGNTSFITIMTYCSAKGLDFDNVFVPQIDSSFRCQADIKMRQFMVALTRSRNNLWISYERTPSPELNKFSSECHFIDIGKIGKATFDDNDDFFGGM